jgi:hypothetical protein
LTAEAPPRTFTFKLTGGIDGKNNDLLHEWV